MPSVRYYLRRQSRYKVSVAPMHHERFQFATKRVTSLAAHSRSWLTHGANLLFPPECSLCRANLPEPANNVPVCGDCRLVLIDHRPTCPNCGVNLPGDADAPLPCPYCRRPRRFQAVVRLGSYEGLLRQAVLRTKRESEQPLAMALGKLLAATRHESLSRLDCQVAVAIPMHWSRRLWRGVNSPELLARSLAVGLRIPAAGHLLRRCRRTRPQVNLAPAERRRNLRGAFRVRPHPDLAGARVLLVDDIMTTGATANEAAKMFHQAGAQFVAVAVLARAAADQV